MAFGKITKAVFPVAGLGSRFLPVTKASPKEMLPVVDKPLIQYAVEEAAAAGITDMIFITGRNKRAIEDHFDKAYELETELAARSKTELLEASAGEVAGIKSATFRVEGDYAYGWLKTEIGVHRLVRKSPFDSDNRRHTSFSSIFVSPEVDDDIDIAINPADLKTDVYRSSGAGGQHVNKTESAVRITHVPSGIVVACQTERSQHANRDRAMKMLRAKLYEMEMLRRNAEKDKLEATKSDIGWGSQIRNYVLDQSRIKDLRTGIERTDTQKVLDGDLDGFIEASLKAGLEAGAKRVDA